MALAIPAAAALISALARLLLALRDAARPFVRLYYEHRIDTLSAAMRAALRDGRIDDARGLLRRLQDAQNALRRCR